MQKQLAIAVLGAGLLALAGCQGAAVKEEMPAPKAAEAPKPVLSEEAKQALNKATADVTAAKEKGALWTTAEDALKKAKEAAAKADSAAVLKDAKIASEHAKLGIEQKSYPLTGMK